MALSLCICSAGFSPPFVAGKKREFRFHPIKEAVVEEPVDITPFLDQLDESLKDKVLLLQKGRSVRSWDGRAGRPPRTAANPTRCV